VSGAVPISERRGVRSVRLSERRGAGLDDRGRLARVAAPLDQSSAYSTIDAAAAAACQASNVAAAVAMTMTNRLTVRMVGLPWISGIAGNGQVHPHPPDNGREWSVRPH
jgi:hypothetical protein